MEREDKGDARAQNGTKTACKEVWIHFENFVKINFDGLPSQELLEEERLKQPKPTLEIISI